jgi:hypothetical protein
MAYDYDQATSFLQVTNRSKVTCIHGGQVSIAVTTKTVNSYGNRPAKVTDKTTVSGCPFRIGSKPSPCTKVHWVAGNPLAQVDGVDGVTMGSFGQCLSSASAPQGPAVIVSTL